MRLILFLIRLFYLIPKYIISNRQKLTLLFYCPELTQIQNFLTYKHWLSSTATGLPPPPGVPLGQETSRNATAELYSQIID